MLCFLSIEVSASTDIRWLDLLHTETQGAELLRDGLESRVLQERAAVMEKRSKIELVCSSSSKHFLSVFLNILSSSFFLYPLVHFPGSALSPLRAASFLSFPSYLIRRLYILVNLDNFLLQPSLSLPLHNDGGIDSRRDNSSRLRCNEDKRILCYGMSSQRRCHQ